MGWSRRLEGCKARVLLQIRLLSTLINGTDGFILSLYVECEAIRWMAMGGCKQLSAVRILTGKHMARVWDDCIDSLYRYGTS